MSGRTSRTKGKVGERELCKWFRDRGLTAERGWQSRGGSAEQPDVKVAELPGVHIECKRTEKLNLYAAMGQACVDAGEGRVPVVFHRRNREPWLVIMLAEDWIERMFHG